MVGGSPAAVCSGAPQLSAGRWRSGGVTTRRRAHSWRHSAGMVQDPAPYSRRRKQQELCVDRQIAAIAALEDTCYQHRINCCWTATQQCSIVGVLLRVVTAATQPCATSK